MALSIDTIYQRVLAVANKEQRGYITPQEFNLLANQVQMDIFEQYFYDLNKASLQPKDPTSPLSDMSELIANKLTPFISVQPVISGTTFPTVNVYRTGRIFVINLTTGDRLVATKVDQNDAYKLQGSTFHKAALDKNPIFRESLINSEDIQVFDSTGLITSNIECEVITQPVKCEWGYTVIGGKAMYNAGRSIDSELHASEESEFVNRILVLAGIIIKQPDLTQAAAMLTQAEIAQETINIKQ